MGLRIEADDYKVRVLRENAKSLRDFEQDFEYLFELVGDASIVLLGESTHGSHEFYFERSQMSKALIEKKGFNVICIEGCWPESFRVNRYIRNWGDDREAIESLRDFKQFPSWMWANADILDFVGWLRDYNDSGSSNFSQVGFYGLDLYSLHKSAHEVLSYLKDIHSDFLERSKELYKCIDQMGHDTQSYAFSATLGLVRPFENDVKAQYREFLQHTENYLESISDPHRREEYFSAVQNSRIVCSAEHYYRTLLRSDVSSWNIRDRHMADTVEQVAQFYRDQELVPKILIWAHNSHIGQARGCDMGQRGEINVGEILKDRHGKQVVSIGFTTHSGTVTAASNWAEHSQKHTVIPALSGSCEDLFHKVGIGDFFLNFRNSSSVSEVLKDELLQRAIGVVYRPDSERISHYYFESLSVQYDGLVHIDHTRAVEPLENKSLWEHGLEAPETYPSGM